MNTATTTTDVKPWIWILLAFGLMCVVLDSCKNGADSGGGGSTDSGGGSTDYTPSRNTIEHRYATERFKQEGLSNSDAQTAADAVIKFHNAQQQRNNR